MLIYKLFHPASPRHCGVSEHTERRQLVCWYCTRVFCGSCLDVPTLLCEIIVCPTCGFQRILDAAPTAPGRTDDKARRHLHRLYRARLESTLGQWRESSVQQYKAVNETIRLWGLSLDKLILPTPPLWLREFLFHKRYPQDKRSAVSVNTLYCLVAAVRAWHEQFSRVTGLDFNPVDNREVQAFLQREKRLYKPVHVQKTAIRDKDLGLFLNLPSERDVGLAHAQLVAAVCFLGILRSSAACGIIWHRDTRISDVLLPQRGSDVTRIIIRADKSQALREATVRYVVEQQAPGRFRLAAFIAWYVTRFNVPDGAQLLAIPNGSDSWRVCKRTAVSAIAKRVAKTQGGSSDDVSSHSFRRGGATWLAHKGATTQQIQEAGWWRSEAVLDYAGTREERIVAMLRGIKC